MSVGSAQMGEVHRLDVNTARGQQTLRDEERCLALISQAYPGWTFAPTLKDREATVDGFFLRDGVVQAVVEQKSRYDVSYDEFVERYNNQWLITFEKIVKARDIANSLCVPLVGLLYIVRDGVCLTQSLWSQSRGWIVDIDIRKTHTQATVNGGKALRDNAYVDMSKAKIVREGNG